MLLAKLEVIYDRHVGCRISCSPSIQDSNCYDGAMLLRRLYGYYTQTLDSKENTLRCSLQGKSIIYGRSQL